MSQHIPESDWRQFKEIHQVLSERFCRQTLEELARMATASEGSAYDTYMEVYRVVQRRHKELARAFDDFRRSTAVMQLTIMRAMGLLTDDELHRFTPETQRVVKELTAFGC